MIDLPSTRGGHALPCLVVAGLLLASCGTAYWSADADAEVHALLAARTDAVLGDLGETVLLPDEDPAAPPPVQAPGKEADPEKKRQPGESKSGKSSGPEKQSASTRLKVDLATALRLAVQHNRDYKTRRETLYLDGLSTSATRFDFGPQLDAGLSGTYGNREDGDESNSAGATLGVGQILPTGGSLSLNSAAGRLRTMGPAPLPSDSVNITTSVGLELTQPLLRGFGYENSHDALIQSEHSLVYGIRNFELFRQEFSITIAESFYELVRQKRTLVNDEQNYDQAVFDRQKAEALHKMQRNDDTDVFRAQRREIESKDALISGRAAFLRARDAFTIQLGLPTSTELEIVPEVPEFQPVRTNIESAILAAKRNRLDLKNQREQLEDARRALRISENGMLPETNLVLRSTWNGDSSRIGGAAPDEWENFVGIEMSIPLQRTLERNRLRSAQIALEQATRAFDLALAELEISIADQIRQLHSLEQRVILQESQIVHQQIAVKVSQFRYESGEIKNRDLLEARQSLINAQNTLISLKASHFIGKLRLLRSLGILFIDEKGAWR